MNNIKFSQEQVDDTILKPMYLYDYMIERGDKGMLGYFPIEDNNSNFDLVEIKTDHPNVQLTPHCKIHGAMSCVSVFNGGKLWRCIQSNQLKDCRAGCREVFGESK